MYVCMYVCVYVYACINIYIYIFTGYRLCRRPLGLRLRSPYKKISDQICSILPWLPEAGVARVPG